MLAGLLILVLGSLGAVYLLRGGSTGGSASAGVTDTSSASEETGDKPRGKASGRPSGQRKPEASGSPTPSPSTAAPGDVTALPAGLFCRDLLARSYSYVAAVNYWRAHGNPNQMDADRNGIPCETVYTPSDVSAYWSVRTLPGTTTVPTWQSGLFCRDLYAMGASYSDAVTYWWNEGAPDRMDADQDGIPCATVYPATDINAYW